MTWLAWLFVGKPLNIATVAALFLVSVVALRVLTVGVVRHTGMLLVASAGWSLYALWEWLVQVRTPEADIRVDLLVIWPLLGILTAWALIRSIR